MRVFFIGVGMQAVACMSSAASLLLLRRQLVAAWLTRGRCRSDVEMGDRVVRHLLRTPARISLPE